jgi:hypothetical protein
MPTPTLNANQIALLTHWQGRGIDPRHLKAGGGQGTKASEGHSSSGTASGGKGTAGGGGSAGRPGGVGNTGNTNASNASNGFSSSNTGGGGGGGGGGVGGVGTGASPAGNATTADLGVANKYGLTPDQYSSATRQYRNAVFDTNNTFNGPMNRIGNALLGTLGSYESYDHSWDQAVDDAKHGIYRNDDQAADRMIDPFQGIATLAGLGLGAPIGSLYAAGTAAFGHPSFGQINTGPSGPSTPGSPSSGPTAGGDRSGGNSRDTRGTSLSDLGVQPQIGGALAAAAAPVTPPTTPNAPGTDAQGYGVTIPYPYDPLHYGERPEGEWRYFSQAPRMQPFPTIPMAEGGQVGFDTSLTPEQEQQFRNWKSVYAPNDSGEDYDLRGAWMSGLKSAANGHWSDQYKKPNEPTFSNESQYAPMARELAGRWDGANHDQYVPMTGRPGRMQGNPDAQQSIGDYANGGGVRGPGDGQDDKIPALLSEGEHVVDAMTVSALGRGSNEAGHKKLEQMKQQVRKTAGIRNPNKAPLMSLAALKVA